MRLKGVEIDRRNGRAFYRTRRGGKTLRVPLPDLPHDHPDFIAAWAEAARAHKAAPKPAAGTLASTWAAVLASDSFHQNGTSYRGYIERAAKAICAQAGHVRAAAIEPRHVRADIAKASDRNARLKAWRLWARVCVEHGWIATDPTAGLKVTMPRRKKDGHPCWSRDDIAAFRAAYPIGTTARAVMEIAYWTGARISDVVKIGPQHVGRDGVLAFQQTKTGDLAYVPWSAPLPPYAASMAGDRDLCKQAVEHMRGGLTFVQTAHGRPRSHKSAGQDISAACRAIDLSLSAHGLRKARAVALADAGATATQIAAWTGHRSLSEVSHYTREADRRRAVIGTDEDQELAAVPAQNGRAAKN